MTRRSLMKKARVPTTDVRWIVPIQLRNDLTATARAIGWNSGELVTLFILRGLKVLRERWNEEAMHTQIPELPSLRLETKGFSIKDVMETLRQVENV